MLQNNNNDNIVMLRGGLLVDPDGLAILKTIFTGSPGHVSQAHIDFLLMSALIFDFFATRVPLPWHVRWAMVVGAFTNSSPFLLFAIFPSTDCKSR